MTRWLSPRPAPKRCSAHTAALASLSTKIGSDTRLPSASRSGSLRHDRCGAKTTVARSVATNPAAPMPIAAMSSVQPASSSSTTETMVSSTTRGLVERCGVSRRARASTRAVGVDDAAGDLGAADVDADGERTVSHGVPPAGRRRH